MERKEYHLENKANEDTIDEIILNEMKNNFLNRDKNEKKISDISTNLNTEESKTKASPDNSFINNYNRESTDKENNNNNNKDEPVSPRKKISIEDFEISYVLGKGSYAKVVLAKNIHTLKIFALKIIDKKFLKRVFTISEINLISKILKSCHVTFFFPILKGIYLYLYL